MANGNTAVAVTVQVLQIFVYLLGIIVMIVWLVQQT